MHLNQRVPTIWYHMRLTVRGGAGTPALELNGVTLPGAPLLGAGIVVTSALYFADRRMKTSDNHFRGFPALWNAVAFYLFLLHMPPALSKQLRLAADFLEKPGPPETPAVETVAKLGP